MYCIHIFGILVHHVQAYVCEHDCRIKQHLMMKYTCSFVAFFHRKSNFVGLAHNVHKPRSDFVLHYQYQSNSTRQRPPSIRIEIPISNTHRHQSQTYTHGRERRNHTLVNWGQHRSQLRRKTNGKGIQPHRCSRHGSERSDGNHIANGAIHIWISRRLDCVGWQDTGGYVS